MSKLKIVNIKISCFFDCELLPQVVKQENGLVFTVYKHSKMHMNISGIKSVNELYKFQQILKCNKFRIDNIMFARKCKQNYNMQKLYKRIKLLYGHKYNIQYDQENQITKGIHVRPIHKPGFSLLIFHTGSCTVMGAKCIQDQRVCEQMLNDIFVESCLML